MTLYVIAGHGAGDTGATGNGYQEAERVRVLANRMAEFGGSQVVVLDTSRNWYADGGISRLNIPRGSEILELHMDSGQSSAMGGHVLDKPGIGFDDYDRAVASFISTFFPGRADSLREQGLGNATRAYNKGYGYRLVECGFITNAGDVRKFNGKMDDLARGLLACFGIGTKEEDGDLKPISIPTGAYPVYRLYNQNTSDHMYTSNVAERDMLVESGWNDEGVGWLGADTGAVVYRLYNPNAGDHMFTVSYDEAANLVNVGWEYEGANFASARDGKSVYRLYNPNDGDHFLTESAMERDSLVNAGWNDEGVAFLAA